MLLLLIVAVVVFYRSGVRSSTDAPPAVGSPVGEMKVAAPLDAQPIDPEAGMHVYRDGGEATGAAPTFTPPPEAVRAAPRAAAAARTGRRRRPAARRPRSGRDHARRSGPSVPAPVTPPPAVKAPAAPARPPPPRRLLGRADRRLLLDRHRRP